MFRHVAQKMLINLLLNNEKTYKKLMLFCVHSIQIVKHAKQIICLYTRGRAGACFGGTHSPLIATVLWGVKIKPFLTEICLFEM